MTSLEDVRVDIAELRGEVRAVGVSLAAHAKVSEAQHARAGARLDDHTGRIRDLEREVAETTASRRQTRVLVSITAALVGVAGAVWHFITGAKV